MSRRPGMNGTSNSTVTASPVRAIAIMPTLAEVDKRGTWYYSVYSQSQGWPG